MAHPTASDGPAKALRGRTCLITGASRGLGRAIALAYWEAGANLLLSARSADLLEALTDELPPASGQRAAIMPADLMDPLAPEHIVSEARRTFDGLDVLVNNAGRQGPIGPCWQNDWTDWQATLQLNLLAPVALCRLCVPWMAEQGGGKIINLSGGGATSVRPRFSAYATAKVGLVRFSEILAEEVRHLGIEVSCVAPGAMDTALLAEVRRAGPAVAGEAEYEAALKAQRTGPSTMGQAAALCAFLASPATDGITGKLISAVWDPWQQLPDHIDDLRGTDIYTLRRIVPRERGLSWGG